MKKIRKQVILAISMLFLALVVCSTAAAADISDNITAVQANNQTAGQLTDHNLTNNNSIQTNTDDKNSSQANASSQNSTNSSSNTVISGHVKKCSSGEPFAGVKITAKKNGTVVASTITKADGSYKLEFQSDGGIFTVTASSPGHNSSSKEVTVKSGSNGTLQGSADFQLGMDNVYISTTGSDITGDGTQGNPYQTIKKGITEVNANGTVHLADGTYTGPYNRGVTLNKNLAIIGQSQLGTIIDAQGLSRIFSIGSGSTVTISNLTLTNGRMDNVGGAINNTGSLTVINCTFTSNRGTYGGAIWNTATLTVVDSMFISNRADFNGGGISDGNSATTPVGVVNVTNSTFTSNTARYGGAIWNHSSPLNVSNCTFTGNSASSSGGAIRNWGTLTVTGSTFTGNSASINADAISNYQGVVEIHFNRFIGNDINDINAENNGGISIVNAENNWWGSNAGPSAGRVTAASGATANYSPWLVLTITANPVTINNGGTSNVIVDLLHDSNGVYHDPLLGHLPDEIPIKLAVPWGSFTNPAINHLITLYTINGSVTDTFYANEGSAPGENPVKATATADGYTTSDTESAYINILSAANLSITKTDSPHPVIAGNPLTYTIIITNNGPASAEGVTLDDVIDNAGAFKVGTLQYRYKVNDDPWGDWFSFSGPLHLDLGTILNGETAVIEINGTVDSSTPKDATITNTATADTTTTPGPKIATSTTTVDTRADLVVTKTGPATVTAGNQLTYTVTVTNNGPSDAQNVVIHDVIPTVLQDVTHDSFDLGTIGAGQSKTVTITGKVSSSTAHGTIMDNSATVTSDTSGTITPSDMVSTVVDTQTALAVTKAGLADVTAGKSYTGLYTINVTNNGPSDAQNVVVTDTLPFNVLGGSYTVNGGSPVSFSGNSLTVDLGTLTSGVTSGIVINGEVDSSTSAGTVTDTANAHTSTGPTYDFASNSFSTTVSVQSVLDVVKESLVGQVVAGVTYTDPIYRITVTNNGPSDARDVQVTDNIPAQIVNREYRVNSGVWTSFSGPLNALVSYIARGVSDVIEVRGSIPSSIPEESMSNMASASVYGTTFNSNTVNTDVLSRATLNVVKTGLSSVTAGKSYTGLYTITVTNNGSSDAQNVRVTDTLPFSIVSGTYTINGGLPVSFSGNSLTVDLGTLAPGVTSSIVINGEVVSSTSAGTVTDTANAHTSTGPTYDFASNSVSTTVNTQSVLNVVKTGLSEVTAGVTYTGLYNVTVTNNGPSDAQNVVAGDPLPFNVSNGRWTLTNASGTVISTGTFSGNTFTVNMGTITPGFTNRRIITVSGTVAPNTPTGTATATATAHTDTGPTHDFTSDPFTTKVNTQSTLDLIKEALINQVVAGVTYTDPIYRITVTNNGPSDARDVQVSDDLPGQIVNREYRVNGGIWTSFTGPLNAFVSYIATGVSDVIEVRGSIPSSTPEGSMSNNASASVYGSTFNSSSVSTSIKRVADVDLTSTVDNGRPDVGDVVTFKVKVRNNGPSDATNIQIWDKLPYGFANVHITGSKGTYADGIWTLDLASGEEATLTLKGVVTPYLAGKTTTNTAVKIHQAEEDPDAHDSTSVSIYVQPLVIIIQKTSILAMYYINHECGSSSGIDPTVKAARTTGMDPTGIPLTGFIVAVLMVLSGLTIPRKK